MKKLVAEGMGIGCLPREYAQNKVALGTIFELDVEPLLPTRSVGIALPKNASVSYALRAFVNLFKPKKNF
jgi:DNA-binding transcriptional LysR family regulator